MFQASDTIRISVYNYKYFQSASKAFFHAWEFKKIIDKPFQFNKLMGQAIPALKYYNIARNRYRSQGGYDEILRQLCQINLSFKINYVCLYTSKYLLAVQRQYSQIQRQFLKQFFRQTRQYFIHFNYQVFTQLQAILNQNIQRISQNAFQFFPKQTAIYFNKRIIKPRLRLLEFNVKQIQQKYSYKVIGQIQQKLQQLTSQQKKLGFKQKQTLLSLELFQGQYLDHTSDKDIQQIKFVYLWQDYKVKQVKIRVVIHNYYTYFGSIFQNNAYRDFIRNTDKDHFNFLGYSALVIQYNSLMKTYIYIDGVTGEFDQKLQAYRQKLDQLYGGLQSVIKKKTNEISSQRLQQIFQQTYKKKQQIGTYIQRQKNRIGQQLQRNKQQFLDKLIKTNNQIDEIKRNLDVDYATRKQLFIFQERFKQLSQNIYRANEDYYLSTKKILSKLEDIDSKAMQNQASFMKKIQQVKESNKALQQNIFKKMQQFNNKFSEKTNQAKYNNLFDNLSKKTDQLSILINGLNQQINQGQSINEIRQKTFQIQNQIQKLNIKIEQYKKVSDNRANRQVKNVQQKLKSMNQLIGRIQQDIVNRKRQIQGYISIPQDIKKLKDLNKEIKNDINNIKVNNLNYEHRLNNFDKQIVNLNQRQDRMKSQINNIIRQNTLNSKEINLFKDQVNQLYKRNRQLKDEFQINNIQFKDQIKNVNRDIMRSDRNLDRLKQLGITAYDQIMKNQQQRFQQNQQSLNRRDREIQEKFFKQQRKLEQYGKSTNLNLQYQRNALIDHSEKLKQIYKNEKKIRDNLSNIPVQISRLVGYGNQNKELTSQILRKNQQIQKGFNKLLFRQSLRQIQSQIQNNIDAKYYVRVNSQLAQYNQKIKKYLKKNQDTIIQRLIKSAKQI